jgi:hypothetical protein
MLKWRHEAKKSRCGPPLKPKRFFKLTLPNTLALASKFSKNLMSCSIKPDVMQHGKTLKAERGFPPPLLFLPAINASAKGNRFQNLRRLLQKSRF